MRYAARVALSLIAVVLVSGCGGGHAKTTVDVRIQSGFGRSAEDKRFTLRCDPVGGDMPNRQALCRVLHAHRDAMLFRVQSSEHMTCLGGPGNPPSVSLSGTSDGEKVNAQVRLCDWPGGAAGTAYWAAADNPDRFIAIASRVHCDDDASLIRRPVRFKLVRKCLYRP